MDVIDMIELLVVNVASRFIYDWLKHPFGKGDDK